VLPDCPHHVVQRGRNRGAVFVEAGDYEYYLSNLRTFKRSLGCRVYGFCPPRRISASLRPDDQSDGFATATPGRACT